MRIVDIVPCYRITAENDMCGMETYIDVGSKLQISVRRGIVFTGCIVRVDYGDSPIEGDILVLKKDNGTLCGIPINSISDIKELQE